MQGDIIFICFFLFWGRVDHGPTKWKGLCLTWRSNNIRKSNYIRKTEKNYIPKQTNITPQTGMWLFLWHHHGSSWTSTLDWPPPPQPLQPASHYLEVRRWQDQNNLKPPQQLLIMAGKRRRRWQNEGGCMHPTSRLDFAPKSPDKLIYYDIWVWFILHLMSFILLATILFGFHCFF